MTKPDDEQPAVVIPRAVFWGLIVPLVGGICAGSAYMASLSMTVANQGTNAVTMNLRVGALESRVDGNKESAATKVDSINDRLTRMEAQLSFLVKTSEGKK